MRNTLLQVIQSASSELGLTIPVAVIAAEDATTILLKALTVAVCDELVQMHDWEALTTSTTFTTVDTLATYPLPSDCYKILNGTLWDRTNRWPILGPKTPSEWAVIKGGLFAGGPRTRYRLQAGKIVLTPTPTSTATVAYDYISYNYVIESGTGLYKAAFASDSDKFIFDDRLVINGIKLKFLETKGFDTTAALIAYNTSLDAVLGADNSAPTLTLTGSMPYPFLTVNNVPDTGYGQ